MTDPSPRIRPVEEQDAAAIAAIHLLGWQTTYRGLMPDAFLDNLRLDDRVGMWRERLGEPKSGDVGFVAEIPESGLVGFVFGGAPREPDLGLSMELALIYLHPDHQRGGIGRRLFRAFSSSCRAAGGNGFYLYVLDGNPAVRFYEALGGSRDGEAFRDFGGRRLREWRYVWTWGIRHES